MKAISIVLAMVALSACRGDRDRAPAADARADTSTIDSARVRDPREDELGPFTVDGRSFTVKFDKQRYGSDEHVVRLRIVDEDGLLHVEERFDSAATVDGMLEYTVTVGATALRGRRGEGLLLWYEYTPSAPLSGTSVKVFAVVDGRLQPLSPPLSVYGSFHELPRDTAAQAERLLPGDVMNVEVWQVWFGVVVPLHVDLGGCAPVAGSTCVRAEPKRRHEASGLGIFDVVGQARPVAADTSVSLYSAPEGKVVGTIPVRPASRVALIEVAAEAVVGGEEGWLDVTVQNEWLHVRIDGRSGWIHGQHSFGAIGLQPAG